ncbi:DnaJ domain-containing protein [Clostridium butyricum]|uniref:DnaJ domain-containing protein n=1 Tax=Clostridium butyricum TaxID=1492 RepID=UPI0018A97E0C|nr:DnaJ domain-containing protein [Clostridium butyricum]
MMKFDVVVNYKGKEYVKLNEALGQANILGMTSKELKAVLRPVSTKLKGLGNTLYVLKTNVTNEPTQVDEEVVRLRKHKEDLLNENLRLREAINELYQEQVKIREEARIENKDLKEEVKKLKEEKIKFEIKIKRLEEDLEIAKMREEHWKKCSEEANAKYYDKITYDFSYELSKLIFDDCEPDIYDEVFLIYYQNKPNNEEELRKNYRQLVRKYHPDVYGDDRIFKQLETIKEAWSNELKY